MKDALAWGEAPADIDSERMQGADSESLFML